MTIHTRAFMRGLIIKPFSSFETATVQDPQQLAAALQAIREIIHMPHFATKIGRKFKLEEITEALQFRAENGGKAVLCPAE